MLDFMVIGLPRTGTTWMSNLLNTERIFCKHDPLNEVHYKDIAGRYGSVKVVNGVSCTALWRWPVWVNLQCCNKLIIHRPLSEIYESLEGIDKYTDLQQSANLDKIEGLHINFEEVFNEKVWEQTLWPHLVGDKIPFDVLRFRELVNMEIQPNFSSLIVNEDVQLALFNEL